MAYPYQIGTGIFLQAPERHASPPVYVGSNIFVVMYDTANDTIEVWKSSDAGVTWAEADSANHKQVSTTTTNLQDFHVYTDDVGAILITYIPNGSATWSLVPFDTSGSGVWGTAIGSGPTVEAQTGASNLIDAAARAMSAPLGGGDYITFYNKKISSGGFDWSAVKYKVYASGSWGSEQDALEPGTTESEEMSYFMSGVGVGDNARVHLLFETLSDGHGHIAYRAGSVYGYFRNDQLRRASLPGSSAPFMATLGSTKFVALPATMWRENTDSRYFPALFLIADEDNPQWRVDYINENFDVPNNWAYASAAYHATSKSIHLAWIFFESGSPNDWTVRIACTKGFGWSAPSDFFTTASGEQIETAIIAFNGDTLGMLLQNQTGDTPYDQPHYYQAAVSACSATGCAASSGNINAAR